MKTQYMGNGLPFVSVIIPLYNNRFFIPLALESLIRQTYPKDKYEIIVIDDGSTDNIREVIKNYMDKIIYVYQEHKGIAGARNKGIALAQGEIITFLDADDMWERGRLEQVTDRFFEKQDVGMVYHAIELIDSKGQSIYKNFSETFGYREGLDGWITDEIVSGYIFCGGSSFAFKREIINRIYPIPEDIKRGIDYYITAVASCFAPAAYIPSVLSQYRLHEQNTTLLRGHNQYIELAFVNKDFALMREKIIEKLNEMNINNIKYIDTIKRIQAKEMMFYHVLSGNRLKAIKCIPSLFKGRLSAHNLLKGIITSAMTLFIPSPLYPKMLKIYDLLKRLKLVGF